MTVTNYLARARHLYQQWKKHSASLLCRTQVPYPFLETPLRPTTHGGHKLKNQLMSIACDYVSDVNITLRISE